MSKKAPFERLLATPGTAEEVIVVGLSKYAESVGLRNLVVGLSGGVDSAVVLALAARTGLPVAPVFIDVDSDPEDFKLAMEVWSSLKWRRNVANLRVVSLTRQCWDVLGELRSQCMVLADGMLQTRYTDGSNVECVLSKADPNGIPVQNTKSRLRMVALRHQANATQALLLGTTNYCEWVTGFFTRGGDSECDVEPIIHLYKSEVVAMARHLGVPESVASRAPSAGLYPGQTDERDLGVTYGDIERWLDGEHVPEVDSIVRRTAFKRFPVPNFGNIEAGRRYDPRSQFLGHVEEKEA